MTPTLEMALVMGFLLGVRHAFDPDHLVAVSTIVSEYRNPLRACWVGVSWGLGHTTTLLLAGLFFLFLRIPISERVALFFEFLVGMVLVVLGLQIFWGFRRHRIHFHPHEHQGEAHHHFHSHLATVEHNHHLRSGWYNWASFLIASIVSGEHRHGRLPETGKPFFRLKSYMVGIVHGLAGSAALMLLVLTSLRSPLAGLVYVLVFGLGSILAMGLITVFISLPFSVSARLPRANQVLQGVAGALGILFGLFLMYEVGVAQRLFA